jgi:hypothetical protein
VTVKEARLASASTFDRITLLSPAVLSEHFESTSIAAPETWGVAMDVPLKYPYALPRRVERMFVPGAPKCTWVELQFENPAKASVLVVAATLMMLGAVKAAG